MDEAGQRVAEALRAVPRAGFLPASVRHHAHLDQPLPIGHGVTNSQPWTVAYMLRRLDVQPGHRVLDVGSGSGWTTALLAHLAAPDGSVLGVEIIPELVTVGRANLAPYSRPGVAITRARPGVFGSPKDGPFDRILVSAAATTVPRPLIEQLAPGGRMLIPVNDDMLVVETSEDGHATAVATGDRFRFVPLV